MLGLPDALGRAEPLRLLALGAHSDDAEIGAGGTVLRLLAERPNVEVRWVVATGGGTPREAEARASAGAFLAGAARAEVAVWEFRDGYLPFEAGAVKDRFEAELKAFGPHVVLTHARDDRHQDHRLMSDLAWNTFRGRAPIAEYEVPKWDGDLGQPNAYVALDEATVARKAELLLAHFPTQAAKPWFTADTFRALARLRGVEAAAPFAEAFTCRKLVW
jgi:LmbE family N-acetylglucosaminyl deacetylase